MRALVPLALVPASLVACSSGGDGGGGGGGTGPPPGAQMRGTMTVLVADSTTLEAEPNDTAAQAHMLGNLNAGDTLTVVGSITDSGSDPFDAFQLNAPGRVVVDLTLTGISTMADLDVYVVDPVTLQAVERYETNSASEAGTFVTNGSFFLVVSAFSGTSDYELRIEATAVPGGGAPEIEPNDFVNDGNYMGTVGVGNDLLVQGDGTDGNSDFFHFAVPQTANLDLSLSFGVGEDYDMYVYDSTGDFQSPGMPFASFETVNNPELGSILMAGMTLLTIEVRPFNSATSPYPLSVAGSTLRIGDPGAAAPPVGFAEARLSPVPRGTFAPRRAGVAASFAEPPCELFAGDLIVQLDDAMVQSTAQLRGVAPTAAFAPELVREMVAPMGGRVDASVPDGPSRVRFELPEGLSESEAACYTVALAATLRGRAGVAIAEPDYRLKAFALPQETRPDDTFYNLQWHYEQINLPAAWAVTTGSNAVTVAVLDTGTTPAMDLVPREIPGFDMISNPQIAGDGDGIDPDPTDVGDSNGPQPSSFHGSHVAGTIGAATDNGYGVAGVTWQTQIFHVRCLGIGGGSTFDIMNSVLYAAGLANTSGQVASPPADIQNLSLGGPGFSQAFQDAINDATASGSLVIAAAGNENSSTPSYPAAYDNVVSVAAVDFERRRAPYSNFHPTVDIAAPGGDVSSDRNGDGYADGVLSTKPDDTTNPTNFENFSFYQGTSMAAPHVAGVAALVLSQNMALTPAGIAAILTSTATDLGAPGQDDEYGAGLVNALAAVQSAGGGGGMGPVLSLQTTSVLFEQASDTRRIGVSNSGSGALDVTSVTATTSNGGPWLSAVTVPGGGVSTNVTGVDVTVNAGGLANGLYGGTVTVNSNGGTRMIAVSLALGTAGQVPSYTVYVIAVDSSTFATLDQDVVNSAGSLAYRLQGLDPGTYFVVAGTDEDNDGFICDPGEPLCGIYPSLELSSTITLVEDEIVTGLDFPLQQPTLAASAQPTGFALLRPGDGNSGDGGEL